MIQDFIEYQDTVALLTRPRRFGKTLNMTMLREFFDITKDSRSIFEGLAIMDTEYAKQINSSPVIYFSFKDCTGRTSDELLNRLSGELFKEYRRYSEIFKEILDKENLFYIDFYQILQSMKNKTITWIRLNDSISHLLTAVSTFYQGTAPILLIDEYDQPLLSSFENGYYDELGDFFSSFYGLALKGNEYLDQALLTGIQRVTKESIFSKLNNIRVYTVLSDRYKTYFGLTTEETKTLLNHYNLELTEEVKRQYNGYLFGNMEIYNPWSILNYADSKRMEKYWINTSTNFLIRKALDNAEVSANLESSFIELQDNDSLWGLLINSGYITVSDQKNELYMTVRIPNSEVKTEFQKIVAEQANLSGRDLQKMFHFLIIGDMDDYMKSLSEKRPHIIIEFKQGENIDELKEDVLRQLINNRYYDGLRGRILCVGIAHNKKR